MKQIGTYSKFLKHKHVVYKWRLCLINIVPFASFEAFRAPKSLNWNALRTINSCNQDIKSSNLEVSRALNISNLEAFRALLPNGQTSRFYTVSGVFQRHVRDFSRCFKSVSMLAFYGWFKDVRYFGRTKKNLNIFAFLLTILLHFYSSGDHHCF